MPWSFHGRCVYIHTYIRHWSAARSQLQIFRYIYTRVSFIQNSKGRAVKCEFDWKIFAAFRRMYVYIKYFGEVIALLRDFWTRDLHFSVDECMHGLILHVIGAFPMSKDFVFQFWIALNHRDNFALKHTSRGAMLMLWISKAQVYIWISFHSISLLWIVLNDLFVSSKWQTSVSHFSLSPLYCDSLISKSLHFQAVKFTFYVVLP